MSVIIQTGTLSITWVCVCPLSYRQGHLVLPGSVCVCYHTDRDTITWVCVCLLYRQEDLVLPGSVCVCYHTDRDT